MDYINYLPLTPPDGIINYALRQDKAMGALVYRAYAHRDFLTGEKINAVMVTCTECGQTWIADRATVNTCHITARVSFGFINSLEGEGVTYGGENSICPCCASQVKVRHVGSVSKGGSYMSTHHPMSVHRIGNTVALVGWWIERRLYKDDGINSVAHDEVFIYPHEAYVLEGRKLIRYSAADKVFNHMRFNRIWARRTRFSDCFGICDTIYPPTFAEMEGTIAENCKLEEYVKAAKFAGDCWPVEYLNMWAKHPNAENIVSSGAGELLASMLAQTKTYADYYYSRSYADHRKLEINWKEVRPSKMLGLTTEEFRRAKAEHWNAKTLALYRYCAEHGEKPTAEEIRMIDAVGGLYGIKRLKEIEAPILKTCRYLAKQNKSLTFYVDYRSMLGQQALTEQELFPGNLSNAHDRLVLIQKIEEDKQKDEKFKTVYEKYKELEWTDGTFDIILPQKNSDLIREGKVLHHCVGGYGNQHIRGKLIFFVRRHIRPERSYFTLNIDMTGETPHEVQLHGYGNERKGSKTWGIPQEVRAFCDRWEKEILEPWHIKNNKTKKEKAA